MGEKQKRPSWFIRTLIIILFIFSIALIIVYVGTQSDLGAFSVIIKTIQSLNFLPSQIKGEALNIGGGVFSLIVILSNQTVDRIIEILRFFTQIVSSRKKEIMDLEPTTELPILPTLALIFVYLLASVLLVGTFY